MITAAKTTCRICDSTEVRHHDTMPSLMPGSDPVTFIECDTCGTVMDSADSTRDYTPEGVTNFNSWPYHQYQFEVGAGLQFMSMLLHIAQCTVRQSDRNKPMQFLDIGGGLGLATEIAKRLGWRGVNVEPSNAGEYCEKLLGVEVLHDYLVPGALPEHSFDVILSSEVIEHVPDPDEFAALIAGYLTDDGVAIFTTPNSEPVRDRSMGEHAMEMLETYNPGFHFTVFSPQSLEQVLRRNGFDDVRVITSEGATGKKRLVAVASRRAGALPPDIRALIDQPKIERQLIDHLTWVVDTRQQQGLRDEWHYGACFRLFEHYVNANDPKQADRFRELIDEHLLERGLTVDTLPLIQASDLHDLLRQLPAYTGKYCYYRGMYELNYLEDPQAAAAYFHASAHVCSVLDSVSLSLGDFRWQARFHEAFALLRCGRHDEGLAILDEVEKVSEKLNPRLRDRIRWERAMTRLQQGDETAAIGQFAAIGMEQFDFIKPAMREPIQHILMACVQRAESIRSQLQSRGQQLEAGAMQIFGELRDLKPQLASRLERIDQLTDRGVKLAGHVDAKLTQCSEPLRECLALGGELRRDLQSHAKKASERVGALIDHGNAVALRLETHIRGCTTHLNEVANHGLDLAQKIERGLSRANDTSLRVQQFFERNQDPAREIIGRCGEIFAALEGTAQTVQRGANFIHRGLTGVGRVVGFPAAVVRRAWRAVGLPSKRVSVRRIGMRSALEFEGRIPLGEIVSGITIEQGIVAQENGLSAVSLSFGTCQRANRCTLQVALVDDQGEIVRATTLAADTLPDNRPYRIDFEPLGDSQGKTYRLRVVSSDASPGNAVTVWSKLCASHQGLIYNGKPIGDGRLMLDLSYSNA